MNGLPVLHHPDWNNSEYAAHKLLNTGLYPAIGAAGGFVAQTLAELRLEDHDGVSFVVARFEGVVELFGSPHAPYEKITPRVNIRRKYYYPVIAGRFRTYRQSVTLYPVAMPEPIQFARQDNEDKWLDHYNMVATLAFPDVEKLPQPVGTNERAAGDNLDLGVDVQVILSGDRIGRRCNGFTAWQVDTADPAAAVDEADVNSDGTVNGLDIAEIVNSMNFGKSVLEADNPRADVNKDGRIDGLDVSEAARKIE